MTMHEAANSFVIDEQKTEIDRAKAYVDLQDDVSKLREEERNYVFLNVGEYANYVLRVHAKQSWKILLEDMTTEQQGQLKNTVDSLLASIRDTEFSNRESTLCGIALRMIQSNLDLANSEMQESKVVEELITEIIDRWVKVYNQMIYKGIANA